MNWDTYFMKITLAVAAKSQDPANKFGAVIVRPHTRNVLSTGYNGIPRNMQYREDYFSRPDKYDYFVHAEENCIFNAAREGVRLEGTVMYVIKPPCSTCSRAIVQAGIEEVVFYDYHPPYDPDDVQDGLDNWRFKLGLAEEILKEGGVRSRRMESDVR